MSLLVYFFLSFLADAVLLFLFDHGAVASQAGVPARLLPGGFPARGGVRALRHVAFDAVSLAEAGLDGLVGRRSLHLLAVGVLVVSYGSLWSRCVSAVSSPAEPPPGPPADPSVEQVDAAVSVAPSPFVPVGSDTGSGGSDTGSDVCAAQLLLSNG